MLHIMFDIDGTLIQSYDLDSKCYVESIKSVLGITPSNDWGAYEHTTDSGILKEILSRLSDTPSFEVIEQRVKHVFLDNLQQSIQQQAIAPLPGAINFLNDLKRRNDISFSIATGGWKESAMLKLKSAGFDINDIVVTSANDHYSRIEIMKKALPKPLRPENVTYFGDGEWDKRACDELGFKFVLVGNRSNYQISIQNFENFDLNSLF